MPRDHESNIDGVAGCRQRQEPTQNSRQPTVSVPDAKNARRSNDGRQVMKALYPFIETVPIVAQYLAEQRYDVLGRGRFVRGFWRRQGSHPALEPIFHNENKQPSRELPDKRNG